MAELFRPTDSGVFEASGGAGLLPTGCFDVDVRWAMDSTVNVTYHCRAGADVLAAIGQGCKAEAEVIQKRLSHANRTE